MKVWILAFVATLFSTASAFAAEIGDEAACGADSTRQETRVETQGGMATTVQRPPSDRHVVAPVQRQANAAPVHVDPPRRRSGKPVPDAELIAPRGAL